jgi:hypothetical protein
MKAKPRFKIIEVKIKESKDSELTEKLDKLIKPSWHVISADFLVSFGDWWIYRVLVDTNPAKSQQL